MGEEKRELTEGQVAAELGVSRFELYLAATEMKLGRYDPLTHLLLFSDAEVDALARRLGLARRHTPPLSEPAPRAAIPEPDGE